MTTRGPTNIFSGEIMPVAPKIDDPELSAFVRNLLDYLRRLTGKLSRFTGTNTGASVLVFAAYADDQEYLSAGDNQIVWTHRLRQDSPYSWSSPSAQIQVSQPGFYLVLVDLMFHPGAAIDTDVWISKVQGTTILSTARYGYSEYGLTDAVSPNNSHTFECPVVLSAGDTIAIYASASSVSLLERGTRITILHLPEESSGTPGIPPGDDPWVPPDDGTCVLCDDWMSKNGNVVLGGTLIYSYGAQDTYANTQANVIAGAPAIVAAGLCGISSVNDIMVYWVNQAHVNSGVTDYATFVAGNPDAPNVFIGEAYFRCADQPT